MKGTVPAWFFDALRASLQYIEDRINKRNTEICNTLKNIKNVEAARKACPLEAFFSAYKKCYNLIWKLSSGLNSGLAVSFDDWVMTAKHLRNLEAAREELLKELPFHVLFAPEEHS